MASGEEVLKKIVEMLNGMQAQMGSVERKIDALSERHNHTNDSIAFMGSAYQRTTEDVGARIKELEERVARLERKAH